MSTQPHRPITEPVERLAAGEGQHGALALVDLCEGVEEAPQVPGAELSVAWLPLLLHDLRHLAGGDRPAVDGADHQVVRVPVLHRFVAVGVGREWCAERNDTNWCHHDGDPPTSSTPAEGALAIAILIPLRRIALLAYWRKPIDQFCEHYHGEKSYPGSENRIIVPDFGSDDGGEVQCRNRLGGLLR